ncbi:MAG: DUF2244 domain-containing protein [Beijerinckiaceae bacterium]
MRRDEGEAALALERDDFRGCGDFHDGASRPGDPVARRLFEARIVPHRSLTPAGFRAVMAGACLISLASRLPFVLLGAWPVAGFMGLDVALLYFAFRANFRAARAYEDIRVTPLELMLAKVTAAGARAEWRFHPAWVRLVRKDHEEFGLLELSLQSRGQRIEVAKFLGPGEKAGLAAKLSQALSEARRGPRFS